MKLDLCRVEIESVGGNPVDLATAVIQQLPAIDGALPIRDIALALDIIEIKTTTLRSIEACLHTDALKSEGQIVLSASSPPRRQRYSIAHELEHCLNERHTPIEPGGFFCNSDDMQTLRGADRHRQQEREANIFAIELLTPRVMLSRHMKRAPDLGRIVELSDRFDVSREAAARRYVDLHHEPLAIVFSENGWVRYVQKGGGFPSTSVWTDDQLGDRLEQPKNQRSMTDLVEVDP